MPRPVPHTQAPELALPVASLAALRQSLEEEVGPDAAARALRRAGHAAGNALVPLLAEKPGAESSAELRETAFWKRIQDLFATRGWGQVAFQPVHPGVGMLESSNWVEADAEFATERPSCFFTTGLLANVLGGATGHEVAVLEVECRSRGDLHCRFLFGSAETLRAVYEAAASGADLDHVLAALS